MPTSFSNRRICVPAATFGVNFSCSSSRNGFPFSRAPTELLFTTIVELFLSFLGRSAIFLRSFSLPWLWVRELDIDTLLLFRLKAPECAASGSAAATAGGAHLHTSLSTPNVSFSHR